MNADIAGILLRIKAVALSVDPPYTWTSGIKSPIYTDNRLILSYPKEREQVIEAFVEAAKQNGDIDGIAATATAGIPWGAWIADRIGKPLVYVRSSSKGHGKQNKVEGLVEKKKTYLIVEDLVSTGKSSLNSADAIKELGGEVAGCVAIFTYGLKKAEDAFSKAGITLTTLTDFETLLEQAIKQEYIQAETKDVILRWKDDPEGWQP